MSEDTPAIVETTNGKIEGIFRKGLYAFRGVPYAAPPVGRLRWLPPEPPEPWSGVRPVLRLASIAPQNPIGLALLDAPVPEPQDEDCLYLNVWTPILDDARRPVMVWIHGGGFTTGSGSSLMYNGRTLSSRGDTVIVTINYRLNVLGFLNLNEVTRGKIPATGNEGLLDQAFALEWVRNNIANFGGDPDNVTIFGESAGGFSVGSQLALPKAKGLFHKAILQSGAAHSAYTNIDSANHVANTFLELLGIGPNDIDGLRSLTVERLLEGQRELGLSLHLLGRDRLGDAPMDPGTLGDDHLASHGHRLQHPRLEPIPHHVVLAGEVGAQFELDHRALGNLNHRGHRLGWCLGGRGRRHGWLALRLGCRT